MRPIASLVLGLLVVSAVRAAGPVSIRFAASPRIGSIQSSNPFPAAGSSFSIYPSVFPSQPQASSPSRGSPYQGGVMMYQASHPWWMGYGAGYGAGSRGYAPAAASVPSASSWRPSYGVQVDPGYSTYVPPRPTRARPAPKVWNTPPPSAAELANFDAQVFGR